MLAKFMIRTLYAFFLCEQVVFLLAPCWAQNCTNNPSLAIADHGNLVRCVMILLSCSVRNPIVAADVADRLDERHLHTFMQLLSSVL
jgi:hypothetical protein